MSGSAFAAWVSSFPGPVVGFGPRVCPGSVVSAARVCGRFVARSGRLAVSGGARGVDSAFVAGAVSVGGSSRVFRPLPGSGVPGLFARSERALRFALAARGGLLVFLPEGAVRGGSLWSFRCALRLGLPVFAVWFGPGGSFRVTQFQPKSPRWWDEGEANEEDSGCDDPDRSGDDLLSGLKVPQSGATAQCGDREGYAGRQRLVGRARSAVRAMKRARTARERADRAWRIRQGLGPSRLDRETFPEEF